MLMNLDKKDRFAQIGNYAIHRHKLLYESTMYLLYWKSRGVIPALKKQHVSFELQQVLIHLMEHHELDNDLIELLSFSDIMLMEEVLRKAKVIESLGYKRPKKIILIESIKHRLYILQGSIGAGTESKEVYKECLELLQKLHSLDGISNYDYYRLKKVLKSV